MIRISTTTLESYRYLVETEWGKEEELIAAVKGEPFPRTWQMEAGTAWHECLEKPEARRKWDYQKDGEPAFYCEAGKYVFDVGDVADAVCMIGPGLWEVKAVKVIEGAQIVAKADHLHGLVIQDNKTRWGKPDDARDREASLQWRFYLLVHEAKLFRYNVFEFAEPDGGGYCQLRNTVSYNFWPYASMEEDCREWVRRFLTWADSKGLLPYLDRKEAA